MSDLSRRRLLQVAGASALLAAARPSDAVALLTGQQEGSFTLDLDDAMTAGGRARAAAGWTQTGVLAAPRRFDLVGVRWRGRAPAGVQLRARGRSGRWSRWVTLPAGDHGSDGVRGARATDPAWTGEAVAIQLRVDRPVRGLAAHFIDTTALTNSRRRTGRPARARSAVSDRPSGPPLSMITRSQWGGDQVAPRKAPSYGDVQLAFVHHTVTANDYTPEQAASIVLGIARYHRDANGWDDIGYNLLVDRHGQIFEGRAGGVEQAVVGAHAQGFNAASTGIACIGTFENSSLTAAGQRALVDLLSWKLAVHGIPAEGKVNVRSAGGSTNRFANGAQVQLDRISGHRDGNRTACPGAALAAALPELRRAVAATTGTSSAVVVEAAPEAPVVTFPEPVALTGRVSGPEGAMAAVAVTVQRRTANGAFVTAARAVTAADGSWRATVPASRTLSLRATAAVAEAAPSRLVRVQVAPRLTLRPRRRRLPRRRLDVQGTVRPAKASVELRVERWVAGRWRAITHRHIRPRRGRWSASVAIRRPGRYRLRATTAADPENAGAAARPVVVVFGGQS
jgi:hypothetical protein